ncbi:hypothetical protein JTE90_014160 [Oedothorax gibbosus]|uniref:Diuretic hormone receptor n=1 Tax=Oedothorax gibbosus TaxID=931172 RepID=A0AAV6VL17_9ARAC|nr:hypothetical protein JTE90_014160 [Oedothorax gibbosus]
MSLQEKNQSLAFPTVDEDNLTRLHCTFPYLNDVDHIAGDSFCKVSWDGVSCWPTTLAGTTATLSCFSELNGVKYDVNSNASRDCLSNGSWSSWSNYRFCLPLQEIPEDDLKVLWDTSEAVTVYYVGYGISLIALTLALGIFTYFRELRCLRNTIHTNLIFTYFLIAITWIFTAQLQSSTNFAARRVACFLTIFLTYLMGTNFFWMFVEGLYLFILVVKTFTVDHIKISIFIGVGWVIPGFIVGIWASVKGFYGNAIEDMSTSHRCPWQIMDYYDYIFIFPVVVVLLVNIIFLIKIMWVLITKLKATSTVESEQYKKAAKALLVLIPLLGVTYILVIATPTHETGEVIFTFIQASLSSTQGLIVAVLYCFLNGEVQNTIKHRLERWRIRRSIRKGQHHVLHCRSSPHEKLYQNRGIRNSCISFEISTSCINFSSRSPSVPIMEDNII